MSIKNYSLPPVAKLSIKYDRKIPVSQMEKITSSITASDILRAYWDEDQINYLEEFKVMFLNNSNKVIGILDLSKGGITGTLVDIRIVLATALEVGATAMILSHNHPSGTLRPSEADKKLTTKIKTAAQTMDLKVLDHIILTDNAYFSFADEGIL